MAAKERKRKNEGQGLTEYIIVVALVAIAGIGIVNLFGKQLRNQFGTIVAAMSGRSLAVETPAEGKISGQTNDRSLKDYASRNR